jgi:hypothetical protein
MLFIELELEEEEERDQFLRVLFMENQRVLVSTN